ncbi:MAG TPA: CoA protein activase [Nitrospirae bacterium]|nr:activator of (R)-2-hydroxyglutaryl-CoA dehydratase [bacterium BMS3Abin06]HDH12244.1 CoA protein activase [Nitrospirota bacterium]HDZ01120.1 CoA protein activase [Nitrospirota bacterium]
MKNFIGLDAGSVSVKLALMDSNGNILKTEYVRHKGNPLTVAHDLLKKLPADSSLSLTGSAGKLIGRSFGIKPVNEVVALSYSTKRLYPETRTIIEIGGEDSKLIVLENGMVKEFSMNSVCAAGTGSFLDQQAERLYLSIEEFSDIALKSKKPPRIAGRCSVFAKSDMIHLQQIATPVEDIVAGLCFAVARNFKGSICKNMELPEPISFQGGVAANSGVRRAFKEVLSVDDLIIPEHFAIMPAIGAVLKDMENGVEFCFEIEKLREFISSLKDEGAGHKPLCKNAEEFEKRHSVSYYIHKPETSGKVNAYLGIDIGSISTNLAVIDEEDRLLAKRYLMTAGRPIEAVKKGLDEIGREVGGRVNICGVGTTGSGRYMIADFVGADIVKNEITAQARAAIEIDPEVDTILEIGGQDSKYISIRDGIIVDFEMNKACAAGTGSFLEEQADKLDISVKKEFGDLAFNSDKPCTLGERCTVFMENSLLSKQQRGAPKGDLVAGLAYSIVQNYINRVVGDRAIGKKIFFQGGVAFNKSVVAAFENYLDKNIIVPPHHDVTGAIGMAIIVKKQMERQNTEEYRSQESGVRSQNTDDRPRTADNGQRVTNFKGFDLSKRNYEIKSFECKGCDNLCEINRVQVEGEKEPLYYGSRCEKYDVRRKKNISTANMPDLFAEREKLLTKSHREYLEKFNGQRSTVNGKRIHRIGIPGIFFFHDFLPFWSTLLWELGFEVELSDKTNRQIVNKGVENILSESCFPHKVAHGHIKDLIDKEIDAVFLPSFINFNSGSGKVRSFACPYAQTMPYIADIVFRDARILKPVIDFELGGDYLVNQLYRSFKPFHISKAAIKSALLKSESNQKEFVSAVKKRGKEILKDIPERTIVIVGRSYNAFDSGINLEIPKKLAALGVFSIPMDYLPIEAIDISGKWTNMYWRSGQNILRAAEIIRDNPKLFTLYIGNFSCGPDSFIQRFFDTTMANKPYLQIEIDEHSADAGVITRCEAFLDSISSRKDISVSNPEKPLPSIMKKGTNNKIVYIPRMSDHAFGLAAAFKKCGLDAEVMNAPDTETVKIGRRYISGKECYPCAITTGDMVKKAMSDDFDPDRAVFFMPSGAGPCRFGQYNVLHRLVLDEVGLPQVPIYAPNQDESLYTELGMVGKDFTTQAWRGIIAIELLVKCLHETRPYEINKGETDNLYKEYLSRVGETLQSRNGTMPQFLNDMRRSFSEIPKTRDKRPLIGIIGEIFVRHNAFANESIIRKIEALGGEAWLAPVEEWIYYINFTGLRKSLARLRNKDFSKENFKDILSTVITRYVQNKIEHNFSEPFEGFLRTLREPSTKEIIKNASPYLHVSFEGEAILSMGKAMDFVKKGASGIISAMPFGCMPGTIVSALLKGLKEDTGIPCLSVAYDGAEATCSEIQLEAFMYQASNYKKVQPLINTNIN